MLSPGNYELLKLFSQPRKQMPDEAERFHALEQQKFIKPYTYSEPQCYNNIIVPPLPETWILTNLGRDMILEFEQQRDEKAKQETQRRFQNKISVLSVLVPFITFILGLIVEHFAGIAKAFFQLFGNGVK